LTLSYSPYPAYKPSGIPWLGDIPAHWGVRRLKNIAQIIPSNVDKIAVEGEKPVKLCNYVDVYKNEHIDHEIDFMKATATDGEINKFLLKKGDVLITKDSESWNDIAIPALVTTDFDDVLCGYHLALLRPQSPEIDGNYLFRSLQSKAFNHQFEIEATGITRYGIDYYAIGNTFFLIPPLPEQQAIAAYLDGETARLDALADRYRRLLALLDEKRRALITQAVTRGLNPTVPLKDSGIEWLGQIPAHWIFDRAKFIFRKMSRPTREEDDVVTAFRDGTVTLRSNRRTEGFTFSIKEIGYQGVRKGDLVIHQMDGFAGAIGVSDSDGKCTPIYSICTPIIPAITHYYGYLLRHMAKSDFILSLAKGIRERSSDFRFDVFRELVLPIPPLPEQQAIAAYLDQETTRLDGLKTKIETLLARLAEYRAALISAAVTGKMDVRDAAFETIQ